MATLLASALTGCTTPVEAEDAYRLGVTALEKNDRTTASAHFRQATASDPTLLEAHLNLAAIDLAEAHPDAALTRLEPLLAADKSQDPRLRYLHAIALLDTDESEAAIEALKALDADDFPEASFLLGQQAYLQGDEGEAEAYFNRYLTLRPEGGFGAETTTQLTALADQLADELEATADAALQGGSDVPLNEEDPEPVIEIPEPVIAEPEPIVKPPDPVIVAPKPQVKPKGDPKPAPSGELSAAEQAWRDARFLEIKKHNYASAITSYRRYLSLAPLGDHATGAQEGIVRCEAALAESKSAMKGDV